DTVTTVTIDTPIAADDIINADEADAVSISGTGEVGATVVLSANGVTLGSAVVGADGNWSAVVDASALAEGDVTVTATATDVAGNVAVDTALVTVDTLAPDVITPVVTDNVANDGGLLDPAEQVFNGDSTNDATPTLTVAAAAIEAGATLTLLVDGAPVAADIITNADGSVSLTPVTPLADGDYSLGYRITDAAGNSTDSPVVDVTVDTSIMANDDLAFVDLGALQTTTYPTVTDSDFDLVGLAEGTGGVENQLSFTINEGTTGSVDIVVSQSALVTVADAINVEVYNSSGDLVYVGTTGNDPLVGNALNIELLGLTGTDTLTATVDGLAPDTYTIVVRNDEGALAALVNDLTLTELGEAGVVLGADNQAAVLNAIETALNADSGLLQLGTAVRLLLEPVLDGTTDIGAGELTGLVSDVLLIGGLGSQLDVVLDVIATELLSNTLTLLETTEVSATVSETGYAADSEATGNVIDPNDAVYDEPGEDIVTLDTALTAITNADNAAVTVTQVNGVQTYTIEGQYGVLVIDANGNYTYTPNGATATPGATDSFTYTLSDGVTTDSAVLTITLSGEPTAPQVDDINNNYSAEGVLLSTTIIGTAQAGIIVNVDTNNDGVFEATTTADADGQFSVTLTPALANAADAELTATDGLGNTSVATPVVGDTVIDVALNSVINNADTNADNIADSSSVSGTTEANATVDVLVDGVVVGSGLADNLGNFSITFAPSLLAGQTLSVSATDSYNNSATTAPVVGTGILANLDTDQLDLGALVTTTNVVVDANDVQLLGLLEGNESPVSNTTFTVPEGTNGDVVITVEQTALLAVADAVNVEVYNSSGELVYVGTTGGNPLVGDVLGIDLLGVTGNNTLVATVSDLAPDDYTIVVRNDESALADLVNGLTLEQLNNLGVVIDSSNVGVVTDAITATLVSTLGSTLGNTVGGTVDTVLTNAVSGGGILSVNQAVALIETAILLPSQETAAINALTSALLSNTLTLLESTDITATLTASQYDDTTQITGNVIDPDAAATGEAGEDVAPAGTAVTEVTLTTADGSEIAATTTDVGGVTQFTLVGRYGTLVLNADGTYTYTANGDFDSLGQTDVFNYTIDDGVNQSQTELVINLGTTTATLTTDAIVRNDTDTINVIGRAVGVDVGTTIAISIADTNGTTINGEAVVQFGGSYSLAVNGSALTGSITTTATAVDDNGTPLLDVNGNTIIAQDTDFKQPTDALGITINADVVLGTGDDTIDVESILGGQISGGDGFDTLVFTGADATISLSDIIETEVIDITGSGANTLTITSEDVINANVGATGLYIRGGSDDTVDLGNTGNDLTEGVGVWTTIGTTTDGDGVTYNVYSFNNDPANQVYIDTNIGNVI
ncbi:beta strand repeat-containing protein, partial [Psychrobacter aestuarii]|uniref:beta strand repeat-containing protein n=1 Tax=Psychrobacter aestuarii TaxID=556327 RepID=UPI00191B584E